MSATHLENFGTHVMMQESTKSISNKHVIAQGDSRRPTWSILSRAGVTGTGRTDATWSIEECTGSEVDWATGPYCTAVGVLTADTIGADTSSEDGVSERVPPPCSAMRGGNYIMPTH